ncbi:Transcriptional regulator GZF3 [Yarrowia lipolytica]|nr:Transcriptional regulator GZF3 [Yarrowia lipolytica]
MGFTPVVVGAGPEPQVKVEGEEAQAGAPGVTAGEAGGAEPPTTGSAAAPSAPGAPSNPTTNPPPSTNASTCPSPSGGTNGATANVNTNTNSDIKNEPKNDTSETAGEARSDSATPNSASVTPTGASSSTAPNAGSSDAPIAPSKDKDNGRGQFSLTPVCQNCQTSTTPLWRRDEAGQVLCNACGLFLKLHGRARPISLKTNVIKSRNRIKNHGHGPGNPAVAHGVQYSVVSASHLPHVHPQHQGHHNGPHPPQQHGAPHSQHPHGPPPPPHHQHAPPGMHVPMHVTHIGHHPPPHMWQGQAPLHHQQQHGPHPHPHPGAQQHAPLHPMAAMKDHPQQHYLPPPQQYASPQFREQQSPSLPGFGSLTGGSSNGGNGGNGSTAPSGTATPAAGATAPATPSAATAPATPAAGSGSPTLKKITSPLLLSNNPPGALPNSALDQLSAAASQSPYLTGQGEHGGAGGPHTAGAGAGSSGPGDLKTRLSELELVNDLFRSRVAEVEAAEQAARRSEASMRESEMLLRSALHRLETRNRVLEKRCKLQQEKLEEAGIKVDDDDDVLEDSDVVLPPLREATSGDAQTQAAPAADGMTSTTILPASPARRRRSSVGGHESAKREFDGLRKKVRVSDLL